MPATDSCCNPALTLLVEICTVYICSSFDVDIIHKHAAATILFADFVSPLTPKIKLIQLGLYNT